MSERLAFLLVGDHLGQVKKVSYPNGKVTLLDNCAEPGKSKPVVSIEPIPNSKHQLIAHKNGELHLYDPIYDTTKACEQASEDLVKALPISKKKTLLLYEKRVVSVESKKDLINLKKGMIHNAQVQNKEIAIVGKDIPLKIFDINTKKNIFEADPPEKNWLGVRPDIYVAGLSYVAQTRVATCSKSDPVIRIYDTKSKPKPIISVDINQTAFNEHADSARYLSVASTGDQGHCIVVGSNVGQILAIDLRFNVKQVPKKKLQPKRHKILGGFKGSRGGSIKDIVIVPAFEENKSAVGSDAEEEEGGGDVEDSSVGEKSQVGYKVISCCLDRYLRIHNFTKTSRQLDKHIYMNTKPLVCSPVFYES